MDDADGQIDMQTFQQQVLMVRQTVLALSAGILWREDDRLDPAVPNGPEPGQGFERRS